MLSPRSVFAANFLGASNILSTIAVGEGIAQLKSGDPIQIGDHRVAVTFRQSGDAYLLVEYGAPVLNLGLRLRVHALTS